jgi:hypothetical protein
MKSFMMMLAVVLVLGVSLGGAFAGGVALGKSQGDDSTADSSGPRPASSLQQQASDQSGEGGSGQLSQGFQRGDASPQDLQRLRERFQSGEIGPDELSQIGQQFQRGDASPEALQGFPERFQPGETGQEELSQIRQRFGQGSGGQGGLSGTINKVEGNTVTIDTPEGAIQATVNDETVIQEFAAVELEDLQAGVQVAVIGQPGEDGPVVARLIFVTPEGASGFFEGGFFSGERPRRDRTAGGGGASGREGSRPD